MRRKSAHIPDERLLLHGSGELPETATTRVQMHIESCARCRARLGQLQRMLRQFSDAHRDSWQAQVLPTDEARAALQAGMARLAAEKRLRSWSSASFAQGRAAALAGMVIAACFLLTFLLRRPADHPALSASLGQWEEPDLHLTPGATVPVTASQICASDTSRSAPAVPVSLKEKVLQLYGVKRAQPDQYELDYLITPELGGATDIRNLWPEPYRETIWNARVKDQLEDRLHQLVCHGDVALATAQHELSTDWIAAYRKYFHASSPLSDPGAPNLSSSSNPPASI
jgi:hypothetical protein